MLQRHLQTVSEKGDQNVRVDAMLQLMMNGTDAKFTLERTEYRFDLCQLHVTRPQHARISCGKVGAQQVVSVTPFRLLEFFLIYTKLEGLARDLLAFLWYLHLHEPECAARLSFRGAQTHQQMNERGEAPAHGTEFSEQASQTFAAHGSLFGFSSFTLGEHIEFTVLLKQFDVHRLADFLPGQIQPLLFILPDLAFGRSDQIKNLACGI